MSGSQCVVDRASLGKRSRSPLWRPWALWPSIMGLAFSTVPVRTHRRQPRAAGAPRIPPPHSALCCLLSASPSPVVSGERLLCLQGGELLSELEAGLSSHSLGLYQSFGLEQRPLGLGLARG